MVILSNVSIDVFPITDLATQERTGSYPTGLKDNTPSQTVETSEGNKNISGQIPRLVRLSGRHLMN